MKKVKTRPARSIREKIKRVFFTLFLLLGLFGFLARRLDLFDRGIFARSDPVQDRGVVTAVYDGDTIKVRFPGGFERRVRLIGVDAPETNDEREEIRFLAYMAKRFAFIHLYRQEVELAFDWQEEDKYGRTLTYVWTEHHGLFNEFIIKEGFAFAYLSFPFKKEYQARFKEAEDEAKREENGFWKSGEYPLIPASEAGAHIGRLLSVRFKCLKVEEKGRYHFLHSSEDGFQVLIPKTHVSGFPELKSFKNKTVEATGLVEDYRGRPQMMVYLPRQLKAS